MLRKLLEAGFRFVSLPHVERYPAVEKNGFVALLDTSEGKLRIFGQMGYRMGKGVGMLVEQTEGKAFIWKSQSIPVTAAMLEGYNRFRRELERLLAEHP